MRRLIFVLALLVGCASASPAKAPKPATTRPKVLVIDGYYCSDDPFPYTFYICYQDV